VRAIYTGTKPSGVSGYDGEITPSEGKIYIDKNTNKQYRWDGTAYVELTAP